VSTTRKLILQWSRRGEWERVLLRLLADQINPAVVAEVKRLNSPDVFKDGFALLNDVAARIGKKPLNEIPALLASRLSAYYEFVTAFHGTRHDSPHDFLEQGLKPSDTRARQANLLDRFGDSHVFRTAIANLRQKGYEQHNEGKIWFCVVKELFLRDERYKHYLLEGSEYDANIASHCDRDANLRPGGEPIIVECRIPVRYLDAEFWRATSYNLLEDYFLRLLRPFQKRPFCETCIAVGCGIPPEDILRVHVFAEVKRTEPSENPLTGKPETIEWISFHLVQILSNQSSA
jgi:hypothetical protein